MTVAGAGSWYSRLPYCSLAIRPVSFGPRDYTRIHSMARMGVAAVNLFAGDLSERKVDLALPELLATLSLAPYKARDRHLGIYVVPKLQIEVPIRFHEMNWSRPKYLQPGRLKS